MQGQWGAELVTCGMFECYTGRYTNYSTECKYFGKRENFVKLKNKMKKAANPDFSLVCSVDL